MTTLVANEGPSLILSLQTYEEELTIPDGYNLGIFRGRWGNGLMINGVDLFPSYDAVSLSTTAAFDVTIPPFFCLGGTVTGVLDSNNAGANAANITITSDLGTATYAGSDPAVSFSEEVEGLTTIRYFSTGFIGGSVTRFVTLNELLPRITDANRELRLKEGDTITGVIGLVELYE